MKKTFCPAIVRGDVLRDNEFEILIVCGRLVFADKRPQKAGRLGYRVLRPSGKVKPKEGLNENQDHFNR